MLEKLIQMGVVYTVGFISVEQEALERFAEVVKETRGERSQREFGDLLGISQSTVFNWENAKNSPDIDGLEKIARIRGQLPEELLAAIYDRTTEASLQDRIDSMSQQEIAWLMMLIAKKLAK